MADNVNHPAHYKMGNGCEVIDITENLNFCRGNAVKYLCRAGSKDPEKEVEDLEKAKWYVEREIQRLKKANQTMTDEDPVHVFNKFCKAHPDCHLCPLNEDKRITDSVCCIGGTSATKEDLEYAVTKIHEVEAKNAED